MPYLDANYGTYWLIRKDPTTGFNGVKKLIRWVNDRVKTEERGLPWLLAKTAVTASAWAAEAARGVQGWHPSEEILRF